MSALACLSKCHAATKGTPHRVSQHRQRGRDERAKEEAAGQKQAFSRRVAAPWQARLTMTKTMHSEEAPRKQVHKKNGSHTEPNIVGG
eukprot:1150199-Pelagomonas_calceolata.AAC.1